MRISSVVPGLLHVQSTHFWVNRDTCISQLPYHASNNFLGLLPLFQDAAQENDYQSITM